MRRFLAAFLLLSAAVLAACGNGDDASSVADPAGDDGNPGNGQADNGGDGIDDGADARPTRRGIPTATPVAEDGVAVLVTANRELTEFSPLDLQQLPQTAIPAGGESHTGVSLADLAAAVGGSEAAFASIEGRSPDGQRFVVAQFALSDVGADSVLVLGDSGNLTFVSESIDSAQWVTAVAAIDFY